MPINFTPTPTLPPSIVQLLAQTDDVIGGSAGASNSIHEQWANYISYLHSLSQYDLERISNGKLTKRTDDNGIVDIFYVLKAFQPDWLANFASWDPGNTHRAFIVNAVQKSQILVSIVPCHNVTVGSVDTMEQNFNEATTFQTLADHRTRIAAKGAGYHVMTCYEYGALVLEGLAQRGELQGNNDSGRTYDAALTPNTQLFGDLISNGAGPGCYPGSGPKEWNHNSREFGVADLIGNYYEFIEGFKTVDGEIYLLGLDNNYSLDESYWIATSMFYNDSGSGDLIIDVSAAALGATINDTYQDIDLSTALKASGNPYVESSVLVDALIASHFVTSGTKQSPNILTVSDGKVVITKAGTRYFGVGGTYNDQTNAGSGAKQSIATSSPGAARYCLIE